MCSLGRLVTLVKAALMAAQMNVLIAEPHDVVMVPFRAKKSAMTVMRSTMMSAPCFAAVLCAAMAMFKRAKTVMMPMKTTWIPAPTIVA